MTDDEIDAAVRALWTYLRPDAPTAAGMSYAREIFRRGMLEAAKICDDYATGSPPGNRTELCGIGARDCAAAIRKAAQ